MNNYVVRVVFGVALFLCQTAASDAHSRGSASGPATGVAISSLSHGQMAVIAEHNVEILSLAERYQTTDQSFRRILNFAHIQRTYCAWGLMPGSVTDEASPFNACSHAYLAASRDLMVRMAAASERDFAVTTLVRKIEMGMITRSTAMELCQFSENAFDTARIIKPDWQGVLRHPLSLLTVLLAVLGSMAVIGLTYRVLPAADHQL